MFYHIFFYITGCSTAPIPVMQKGVNYQRDINVHVEYWDSGKKKFGQTEKFTGTGVLKKADHYKFTIFAKGKVDTITIGSCHRDFKAAKPKKSWWTSGHVFKLKINHNKETNKACAIDIGLLEQKMGRHGWAMFAIESDRAKLPVTRLECNGVVTESKTQTVYYDEEFRTYGMRVGGTSFCQAKTGKIQSIHFDRDVEYASYYGCLIKTPPNGYGKDWEFVMPPGRCVMFFIDRKAPDLFHKSVWWGFDAIPNRGVK